MSDYQKRLVIQPPKRGGSRLVLGTYGTGAAQIPAAANAPIPPSIVSAGPNITAASLGTPVATGTATVHQPYTITIGDFLASKNPPWFQGIKVYKRAHGDTHVVPIGKLDPQASSVTWTNAVDLGSGATTWDIGFSYSGTGMSESVIVWPSALANIDPGKLLQIGANAVTWNTFKGDTSGDTTTAVADTTNKRFTHPAMSTGVQSAVDSGGNVLTVEFAGGKIQSDGSLTNVDGASSATHYTLVNGQPFTASADIAKGSSSSNALVILGNSTNGYAIVNDWSGATGRVYLIKYVGTTPTVLSGISNVTSDTAYHTYRLTVTPGASNFIEGSVDDVYFSASDNSLTLTSGTWPVTLQTAGSTGTVQHYHAGATPQHYGNTPTSYQGNFDYTGNAKASTMFTSTTPNTIAYVTDATIEFSWTGTGPYTVNIWFDNGTAATDAKVIMPTGTTINLGHTTSGSPSYTESGVAGGTNYYVVLSRAANGTVTLTVQKTPFTLSAFAAYFADGGIVPAAAQAGTPLFTPSGGGGSGGHSGGGGGRALN